MTRTITLLLGVFLFAAGVLGFVPSLSTDGRLFGMFHLNFAHNLLHIIVGLAALWSTFTSGKMAKLFLQVFGILFGILAILGFIYGNQPLLGGYIANNAANTWVHLLLAAIALYFGFFCNCSKESH